MLWVAYAALKNITAMRCGKFNETAHLPHERRFDNRYFLDLIKIV